MILTIARDKSFRDYNSVDFVKYFGRKYFETTGKPYRANFARDCSIVLKIMRRFFEADLPLKEIFPFMDEMFVEYPKRRRIKPIDLSWLHGVTNMYLKKGDTGDETSLKAKAPKVELDAEMQEWLKKEKERWLKKGDSAV